MRIRRPAMSALTGLLLFCGVSMAPAADKEALLHPDKMTDQAPDTFRVKFDTTEGDFVIEVHRDWSPRGADRFFNLVRHGYFDGVKFFRVVQDFVVQFGIHGDPEISKVWMNADMPDDPVKESNRRGFVTYAKSRAPNSRSTQLFINLKDNTPLDGMGFSPFGRVVEGMEVVDRIHSGYGEAPNQGMIFRQGNAYLEKEFPELDTIKTAQLLP